MLGLILFPLWSIEGTAIGSGLVAGGILSIEASAFAPQIIGVVVITIWTVLATAAVWGAFKLVGEARVTPDHERDGLDLAEHGVDTYPSSAVPTWRPTAATLRTTSSVRTAVSDSMSRGPRRSFDPTAASRTTARSR